MRNPPEPKRSVKVTLEAEHFGGSNSNGSRRFRRAAHLEFAVHFDLPLDYMPELAVLAARVTPAELRALIASELAEKRQVIGLLGSANAIAAGRNGALAPPVPPVAHGRAGIDEARRDREKFGEPVIAGEPETA